MRWLITCPKVLAAESCRELDIEDACATSSRGLSLAVDERMSRLSTRSLLEITQGSAGWAVWRGWECGSIYGEP